MEQDLIHVHFFGLDDREGHRPAERIGINGVGPVKVVQPRCDIWFACTSWQFSVDRACGDDRRADAPLFDVLPQAVGQGPHSLLGGGPHRSVGADLVVRHRGHLGQCRLQGSRFKLAKFRFVVESSRSLTTNSCQVLLTSLPPSLGTATASLNAFSRAFSTASIRS